MSNSLTYEGNGVYSTYLESGKVNITKEEIYELVRSVSKLEQIPTLVEEFDFKTMWDLSVKDVIATITDINKTADKTLSNSNETEIEELADSIIVNAQKYALDFYKNNYIMLEK